jgi:hypothetical protein
MANQIHAYKDRDIKRVVKAARSAGLDPTAVEVDTKTGKIKVFSSGGSESEAAKAWEAETKKLSAT